MNLPLLTLWWTLPLAGAVLLILVGNAGGRRDDLIRWIAMAVSLAASSIIDNAWWFAACLFVMGGASGVISVYFQLLISAVSTPEQRGSAMSYGGVGWNPCVEELVEAQPQKCVG